MKIMQCRTNNIRINKESIPSRYKMYKLTLTSFYIMECIDDITRSKRVDEHCHTVQEEDKFLCKSSGSWFTWITCYVIDMACIIIYCQDP